MQILLAMEHICCSIIAKTEMGFCEKCGMEKMNGVGRDANSGVNPFPFSFKIETPH